MILEEGITDDINDSVGKAVKTFSVSFTKVKTLFTILSEFCLTLHYNGDDIYLYINKTDVCKLEASYNLLTNFVWVMRLQLL